MIPSFAPIHEYFRAALRAETAESTQDRETGLVQKTLYELANAKPNQDWRFVDGPHINYLDIVKGESSFQNMATFSPLTTDGHPIDWTGTQDPNNNTVPNALATTPRVAVVGAGMSGLLTGLQLRKAGMEVTMFEAYGSPVRQTSKAVTGAVTGRGHAGRVFPLEIDGTVATESQMGCMRFPQRSPLFWWYLSASSAAGRQSKSVTFTQFPNPGVVPTVFTGYNATESPLGTCDPLWTQPATWGTDAAGNYKSPYLWSKEPFNYPDLNKRHFACFTNFIPDPTLGLTGLQNPGPVSFDRLQDIQNLLKSGATELARITKFWNATVAQLANVSYKEFLVDAEGKFHHDIVLSQDDIARIGTLGFGTGGFAPLFDVCVLDIMRIVLWDYAEEMEVPGLAEYPIQLMKTFETAWTESVGGAQSIQFDTPVDAVAYVPSVGGSAPYYYLHTKTGGTYEFDYVVLAMTHTAAAWLIASTVSLNTTQSLPSGSIVPYGDTTRSSNIMTGLLNQNIMKTTKIFHLIQGPASTFGIADNTTWTAIKPVAKGETRKSKKFDHRIRALFGAFDTSVSGSVPIGVTYLLPLMNKNYTKLTLAGSSQVNALHYSWGYGWDTTTDSDLTETLLATNKSIAASLSRGSGVWRGVAGADIYQLIETATASRFSNFGWAGFTGSLDPDVPASANNLLQYFTSSKTTSQNADLVAINWEQVPYVLGAFKLDAPGFGPHLTFAYKVLSESTAITGTSSTPWDTQITSGSNAPYYQVDVAVRGLFFAGDSFSNYGGWVEGAFQSALATSAGIIKQAHVDRWGSGVASSDSWQQTNPFYSKAAIDALVTNARDPYAFPQPTTFPYNVGGTSQSEKKEYANAAQH